MTKDFVYVTIKNQKENKMYSQNLSVLDFCKKNESAEKRGGEESP